MVQIRVTGEGIMGRMKNKEAEEVLKGNPEFPKKKDDWARDRAVAIQIVKRDWGWARETQVGTLTLINDYHIWTVFLK